MLKGEKRSILSKAQSSYTVFRNLPANRSRNDSFACYVCIDSTYQRNFISRAKRPSYPSKIPLACLQHNSCFLIL